MAKCRSLIAENEELGKALETGRLAQLEGELALLRKSRDQLTTSQAGYTCLSAPAPSDPGRDEAWAADVDNLLTDLDEDCEGLQATVVFLQKELEALKRENERLRGEAAPEPAAATNGVPSPGLGTSDASPPAPPAKKPRPSEDDERTSPGPGPSPSPDLNGFHLPRPAQPL